MTMKSDILRKQLTWAHKAGLEPDELGYLKSYEQNLFQPLNRQSREAFDKGSGSELRDRPTGPAKMRALHSSSALAVNFFDAWVGKDTRPYWASMSFHTRIWLHDWNPVQGFPRHIWSIFVRGTCRITGDFR